MIVLRENLIDTTRIISSNDYRYIIEELDNGFVRGVDMTTQKETALVPMSHIDAVLSDMKELFHEDFRLNMNEALTASAIRNKSDKLQRQGYSCRYDIVDSSITILSKDGSTVFKAIGKQADSVVQDFEEDPVSLDTTISIEDYCLAKFL